MRHLLLLAIFFAAILGASTASAPVAAAGLTVVIEKLRSGAGTVHLALWNRAEGFTDADAALTLRELPAAPGQIRFHLGDLKPGLYAIATYHDENGNGKFDKTWIGWPDEGLGFSNGAWISLGPPSFEEAAFEVRSKSQVVAVALRYPSSEPVARLRLDSQ
jgi:uncharacterized protein (DUF2141 family)